MAEYSLDIVSHRIRKSMRGNRSVNTKPERVIRKVLWANGYRGFRKNYQNIVGKPDIFFPKQRLVIFVNGCFWHRCPRCKLPLPKTNKLFWKKKFQYNQRRDRIIVDTLRRGKYKVIVIWECQIERSIDGVIEKISTAIKSTHNN